MPTGPSSTWTYLVSDDPFRPFRVGLVGAGDVVGSFAAAAEGIALLLAVPARMVRSLGRRLRRLLVSGRGGNASDSDDAGDRRDGA